MENKGFYINDLPQSGEVTFLAACRDILGPIAHDIRYLTQSVAGCGLIVDYPTQSDQRIYLSVSKFTLGPFEQPFNRRR